jgi:tetratricopeptide (TPR) repeat protein
LKELTGNTDHALADLNEQIRSNPTDALAYTIRGDIWSQKENLSEAVQDYSQAIELKSTRPPAPLLLIARGTANKRSGNAVEAISDFLRAADMFYERSEFESAVVAALLVIDLDPDNVAAWYKRGLGREFENDYSGALHDFEQASKVAPSDAKVLGSLCWVEAVVGELDPALAHCNEALRLAPGSALILDSRGLVYLKRGDPEQALQDYNDALAGEPKLATSLYGRGLAMRYVDPLRAGADLSAAKEIVPNIADEFVKYGVPKPWPAP